MLDARGGDFRHIPFGIRSLQNSIGRPSTRCSTPAFVRCADTESPYGPAPITRVSIELGRMQTLSFCEVAQRHGRCNGRVQGHGGHVPLCEVTERACVYLWPCKRKPRKYRAEASVPSR